MIEEHVDLLDNNTKDDVCQHVWGVRYIDDAVLRRVDKNVDGDYVDAADQHWYYVNDAQFSVAAVLDQNAIMQERIYYSPYGVARNQLEHTVE